jgi:hypothetical protein
MVLRLVASISHQRKRLSWDGAVDSSRETNEKWMESFKGYKAAVCFVNPSNPLKSVLVRPIAKPPLFVVPVTTFS